MHIRSAFIGFIGLLFVCGSAAPIVATAQPVEPPVEAPVEAQWLSDISTCEQLKGEIRARFGAVSDLAKLEEPKRSEMEVVINVACSARFAGCRFKVCRERNSSVSVSSSANFSEQLSSLRAATASVASQIELVPLSSASTSSSSMAESAINAVSSSAASSELTSSSVTSDLLAASSSLEASSAESSFEPSSTSQSSASQASASQSSSSRPSPFIVDPLAWLTKEMSCEQFLEQTQVRFGFFGAYEDYPAEKQLEMQRVLQAACDSRYAHCKFPMCPLEGREVGGAVALLLGGEGSSSSGIDSTGSASFMSVSSEPPQPPVETSGEKDRAFYRSLVTQLADERRALIAAAEKREKEQGLVWQRFLIPEDVKEEQAQVLLDAKKDETKSSGASDSGVKPSQSPPNQTDSAPARATERPSHKSSDKSPKGGNQGDSGTWFDRDASDQQIGILPPLPPAPAVDPHRRK